MQSVYEILKEQGVELKDREGFEKTFFKNYKSVAEFDKKNSEIENLKTNIKQYETDLKNVREKISSNDKNETKITELNTALEELQKKYENAEKEFKENMNTQQYNYAVRDAVSGIKFSSNSAKELFEQKLINQKLPVENGKIMGLSDFIDNYKKNDADAFAKEKKEAFFSGKSSGNSNDAKEEKSFSRHEADSYIM